MPVAFARCAVVNGAHGFKGRRTCCGSLSPKNAPRRRGRIAAGAAAADLFCTIENTNQTDVLKDPISILRTKKIEVGIDYTAPWILLTRPFALFIPSLEVEPQRGSAGEHSYLEALPHFSMKFVFQTVV